MSSFGIFDYLDTALVERESRAPRAATVPAVWPSEASAERFDKTVNNIAGRCHRASYYRMIGAPVTNQVDPIGAWRWTTGRLIENQLVELSQISVPPIYVANGVRIYVPEFYLPLELDLVAIDPHSKRGWIAECKTYYGYSAKSEIEKKGHPKVENLMQDCIYLLEVGTGAKMKELVRQSLQDRTNLDAYQQEMATRGFKFEHRNRCEANLERLEQMDDGPIGAKLVYVSRDECARTEFNISIQEDYDGSHYPVVNGVVWKIFTVESIYQRFRQLQGYWFRARREAVDRLRGRGIEPPASLKLVLAPGDTRDPETQTLTDAERQAREAYLSQLNAEVLRLPDTYLPPAEYEWAYTPDKIERLFQTGDIKKTRYGYWKKQRPGYTQIGDWACRYCSYKRLCIPKVNPSWAYMLEQSTNSDEED